MVHLDESAIDRILKAVGPVPHDPDKQQLLSDLEGVSTLHPIGERLRAPASRSKLLKETAAAKKLELLFKRFSDEVEERRLRRCRKEVDGLVAYIERNPLAKVLGVKETTALENLVGVALWSTFKNHFGVPTRKYTKNSYNGDVQGQFIDFAHAALRELGITVRGRLASRQAIADAWTSGNRRRRRLTEKLKQK
jgi:hypothetical protein